jgi:hypothetical protein
MATRRLILAVLASVFFILASSPARADIEIRIGLPEIVIKAPPVLVVVPGLYVYVAPDLPSDIAFYQGVWFRLHDGFWYRGSGYKGPWSKVPPGKVPGPLRGLRPGFRDQPRGADRMQSADVERNWQKWEKEKRWDSPEGGKGKKNK